MQGIISCILVLTLALLLVALYCQYRKFNIRELKNKAEILRTSLSLEGIFFGIIVITMAYSLEPNVMIILPIFSFFLVLFLRIMQIEDIEKELRENCERDARKQTAEWYRNTILFLPQNSLP